MKNIIKILVLLAVIFQFDSVLAADSYKKPQLSKEDMDKLLGKWHGKPILPKGALGGVPTYVFQFEIKEKNEFEGLINIVLPSGMLASDHKIADMGKNGDRFIFKVPTMKAEYRGSLDGGDLTGELNQFGSAVSLVLKKGEYIHKVNNRINLSDDITKFLSGKWSGKVEHFRMVFEFEKTETGDFKGHIISRDQLDGVIPITEAIINNKKLILKTEDFEVQFEMQLSENTLTGEWTQCEVSYPLTLTKKP